MFRQISVLPIDLGSSSVTPAFATILGEAAAVCLEENRHASGVLLSVDGMAQGGEKDTAMRKYILTADCPCERLDNVGRGFAESTLPKGTRFTIEADRSRVAGYPLDREYYTIKNKGKMFRIEARTLKYSMTEDQE
jgi:hypothetical protein